MTDARIPERWLNDRRVQRLSAEHYRSYFNALLWSVANRTDGRIEREDLGLIPHWSPHAAQAFVDAGLFTPAPDGWLIADYASTQTSRDELEMLERMRAADRQRKKQKRGTSKPVPEEIPPDTPQDVPPDDPPDVPTGQHRQAGRQAGRQAKKAGVAPVQDLDEPRREWPEWHGQGPDIFKEYA